MPFAISGTVTHVGKTIIGFEAKLELNRYEFQITYDKLMDNGGLIVGDTVRIELTGRAIKEG